MGDDPNEDLLADVLGAGPVVDSTGMQGLQVDTLADTTGTDTTDTTGTTPPPR